ncbi:MAG TPA: hypothetical protein VEA61_12045 [Allosphingosinicella sp.]|nr:hypothetical protein [Allosphingosinicella sp.]
MRSVLRPAAAALIAAAVPAAGEACSYSPGLALIHSALPTRLPKGVFVAEVEIDRSTVRESRDAVALARVTKVIQGDPDVSQLRLRMGPITHCDEPLANGAAGLLLGLPRGREGHALVVEPIFVHRIYAYRLPDGFSLPAECRGESCRVRTLPSPAPHRAKRRRR